MKQDQYFGWSDAHKTKLFFPGYFLYFLALIVFDKYLDMCLLILNWATISSIECLHFNDQDYYGWQED